MDRKLQQNIRWLPIYGCLSIDEFKRLNTLHKMNLYKLSLPFAIIQIPMHLFSRPQECVIGSKIGPLPSYGHFRHTVYCVR